jgi:hypothetical protein
MTVNVPPVIAPDTVMVRAGGDRRQHRDAVGPVVAATPSSVVRVTPATGAGHRQGRVALASLMIGLTTTTMAVVPNGTSVGSTVVPSSPPQAAASTAARAGMATRGAVIAEGDCNRRTATGAMRYAHLRAWLDCGVR